MSGETLRTEAYLLGTLLADNTSGDISPLDLRDAIYSLFHSYGFNLTAPAVEPANVAGALYWFNDELNIGTGITGVVGQPMTEKWAPLCRNNTGVAISNGSACYISGALGSHTTTALAVNTDDTSQKTIGLATHDIGINATGYITTHGIVRNVNTSAWVEGTVLYLGSTPGSLTSTRPVGTERVVEIGIVSHQDASVGQICVAIRQWRPTILPFGINESRPLTDSASYQDLYVWSWEDVTFPVIAGQTPTSDLTIEGYRDTGVQKAFVRHDQDNTFSIEHEMPHAWAQTAVKLHLHVIPMAAGSGDVVYDGYYFFGGITDTIPALSGWTAIAKTDSLVSGDQYKGRLVSLATCAAPASPSHSSVLHAIIRRNGTSLSDTYTTSKVSPPTPCTAAANLCVTEVDVHYQRLGTGSFAEVTGSPVTNPARCYFDKTWIAGTPEMFILARSTNGNPVSFQLWDVAAAAQVGATMTTSNTTFQMLGTGSLAAMASGTRELRVRAKYDAGSDTPVFGVAIMLVR